MQRLAFLNVSITEIVIFLSKISFSVSLAWENMKQFDEVTSMLPFTGGKEKKKVFSFFPQFHFIHRRICCNS